MAIKQTRRTISVARHIYDRAKSHAATLGLTLAHFTERALLAAGVDAPAGMHQSPAVARLARVRRVASAREVMRRVGQGMPRKEQR